MASESPTPFNTMDSLNREIIACEACERLRTHCRRVASEKRRAFAKDAYWGRPVPNLGPAPAAVLIVGLAPAAHGANRTGRMFTGDRSGQWLFRALHRAGFANQPTYESANDGLRLTDCVITAVCHCAPPENKPTREERAACRPWLEHTVDLVRPRVLLALGKLAFDACCDLAKRRGWRSGPRPKFAHGVRVELEDRRRLWGSYHPSQQNTFTGKLTEPMLDDVMRSVRQDADLPA